MPLSDSDIFRNSEIVKRIVSTSFDGLSDNYILKIRAELSNGWLLDYFEHKTPSLRRYSFHVFHEKKMIVRWDNAPHYSRLKGFPNHKHVGNEVVESEEMTASKLLKELKDMIK